MLVWCPDSVFSVHSCRSAFIRNRRSKSTDLQGQDQRSSVSKYLCVCVFSSRFCPENIWLCVCRVFRTPSVFSFVPQRSEWHLSLWVSHKSEMEMLWKHSDIVILKIIECPPGTEVFLARLVNRYTWNWSRYTWRCHLGLHNSKTEWCLMFSIVKVFVRCREAGEC